jgi:hypothetical protein
MDRGDAALFVMTLLCASRRRLTPPTERVEGIPPCKKSVGG